MTKLSFRAALPEEASALSQLAFDSKATHGYSAEFMEACRAELTWTSQDIISEDYRFIVAESEGKLAGFGAISMQASDEAELEALFVAPGYSGQGIGGGLLQVVAAAARSAGISQLAIQSDPGAVPFYAKFGAVQVGESASGSIPGRTLPDLILDVRHPSLKESP